MFGSKRKTEETAARRAYAAAVATLAPVRSNWTFLQGRRTNLEAITPTLAARDAKARESAERAVSQVALGAAEQNHLTKARSDAAAAADELATHAQLIEAIDAEIARNADAIAAAEFAVVEAHRELMREVAMEIGAEWAKACAEWSHKFAFLRAFGAAGTDPSRLVEKAILDVGRDPATICEANGVDRLPATVVPADLIVTASVLGGADSLKGWMSNREPEVVE